MILEKHYFFSGYLFFIILYFQVDVDGDHTPDCVLTGRHASVQAVSHSTGGFNDNIKKTTNVESYPY